MPQLLWNEGSAPYAPAGRWSGAAPVCPGLRCAAAALFLDRGPAAGSLRIVKRETVRLRRGAKNDDVDVGQIREMLRLTPTQRLRKAWRYAALVREMQRAAGLQPRHS
jgi:hypothetical protein